MGAGDSCSGRAGDGGVGMECSDSGGARNSGEVETRGTDSGGAETAGRHPAT